MNPAVERIRDGNWSPYSDFKPLADPALQAKAEAASRLIKSTFTSPAGRKVLDWLIGAYLLRMSEPDSPTQAAYRAGQASVVAQILHEINTAEKVSNGN